MNETLISVENLTAGYGRYIILQDVSFQVRRGEICIILGGSGCGKTTLMNQLIGLQQPVSGKILFRGKDLVTASEQDRQTILSTIGVAFQSGALFGSLTLLENVLLPLEEHTHLPRRARELIAIQKLQQVGLAGYENNMPSQLSGGMQKRAALARAMVLDPEILFLDEPSAGLDPVTAVNLDNLILQLSRTLGITFVIVTHELQSIFTLGGRAVMLDKSKKGIVAEGNPQELKNDKSNPVAWQFFNRTTETIPAGVNN